MPDEERPTLRELRTALRQILCGVGVVVVWLTFCAVRLVIEGGFGPESFQPTDLGWWGRLLVYALFVLILPR
jgi:hypothetical protein